MSGWSLAWRGWSESGMAVTIQLSNTRKHIIKSSFRQRGPLLCPIVFINSTSSENGSCLEMIPILLRLGSIRQPRNVQSKGIDRWAVYPIGIKSFSPGSRATSHPGATSHNPINPERVESNRSTPHHPVVPQTPAKILMHTVFSTKDRRPLLPR